MERTLSVKITRLKSGEVSETQDKVVRENILIIRVNSRQVVGVVYLPGEERELVFGHLFTTGVIENPNEVQDYTYSNYTANITLKEGIDIEDRLATCITGRRLVTSACGPPEYFIQLKQGLGIPKVMSDLRVKSDVILSSAKIMNDEAMIFRETGGTHAAALFSEQGDLMYLSEDVGRHNAVDKVIGAAILSGKSFDKSFLMSTGRQTVDMVVKVARASIPIVASLSAATDSGVSAAESTNITLIGFTRGKRMNIYTNPQRVIL
ncbi:MAG: formate dehydrogenase accessory sulfurtransferase FdhD [Candidatus Jordarchaeum sp.]|uniref:formate dehydrogenase accessory sulfurtransferase FdhD n=1 Tax=Candidatus Jordarchaeum sp. TaxID=2823881 RepID=UPI00404A7422